MFSVSEERLCCDVSGQMAKLWTGALRVRNSMEGYVIKNNKQTNNDNNNKNQTNRQKRVHDVMRDGRACSQCPPSTQGEKQGFFA